MCYARAGRLLLTGDSQQGVGKCWNMFRGLGFRVSKLFFETAMLHSLLEQNL